MAGRLLPTRTWNHGDWRRDTLRGTSAPLEEEHRALHRSVVLRDVAKKCVNSYTIYKIQIFRKLASLLPVSTSHLLYLRLKPFIWQSNWPKHFQLLFDISIIVSPMSLILPILFSRMCKQVIPEGMDPELLEHLFTWNCWVRGWYHWSW